MNIFVSDNFGIGWRDKLTGGGSFSLTQSNRILRASSITGSSNGAMKDWNFLATPGDVIEISVWARAVSGTPRIALDLRNVSDVNVKTLLSEDVQGSDWKLYKTRIEVPYNVPAFALATFVLGVPNSVSTASVGEYHSPKIEVKSGRSVPQLVAQGLIRVENGVPTLHGSFKHFGIGSLSYSDTTKLVTINLEKPMSFFQQPIIQATTIIDAIGSVVVGQTFAGDTPNFKLAFAQGNVKQSLATGVHQAFVSIYF